MEVSVDPLYLTDRDIFGSIQPANPISDLEICKAMATVIPNSDIYGVQLIRGTWLLYIRDNNSRIMILSHME